MSYLEKNLFIENLKKYLNKLISDKPTINIIRLKKGMNLCSCGEKKWIDSKNCKLCYNKLYKKERPTKENLFKEIEELGYSAVGRKYGVSDNAIRKWLK